MPEDGQAAPSVVSPGATLPLGTTVSLDADGTYSLPAQAATITVRCFGQVTVTFMTLGGSTKTTHARAPVARRLRRTAWRCRGRDFDFDAGGSAEVTVR